MIEENIRVSVIIPTFKRESKYLLRAIESIKSQTYKNIEIIVIDDNPPNSEYRNQIMGFMLGYSDDANVNYFMNPKNVGGSIARNNGINIASGEYITFLDDDDEYLPNKVERQLDFMMTTGADMSFTDLKLVNNEKKIVEYREYHKLKKFDKTSLLKFHIMRHLTGTPTFMYKTQKLRSIGGFEDSKMGQEFYLMLKSIEMDLNIQYLSECDVLAYRHNEGGISQGKNKIIGEKLLYKFKKKYFHLFSLREKMFIVFRHYAVMVVAYKRNNNYLHALLSGVVMIFVSPFDFLSELRLFIKNKSKYKKVEN